MKRLMRVTAAVLCFSLTGYWGPANSQQPNAPEVLRPAICDQFTVDGRASTPLRAVTLPPLQTCTTHTSNGFPVPDPNCTPGAINPTLTIEVLRDRRFTTRCIRDSATPALRLPWVGIEPVRRRITFRAGRTGVRQPAVTLVHAVQRIHRRYCSARRPARDTPS
jgi:hypothetical protein